MDRLFILLLCWTCWGFAVCRRFPRSQCLVHSQTKCNPHPRSTAPGPNEYTEYITRIRKPPGQLPVCTYLDPSVHPNFEIIRRIDNLNQPNFLLLQSPNFGPGKIYRNRRLVSYNVQCPTGRLPFLVFNAINIQPRECFGFCEDFITITPKCTDLGVDANGCGSSTSCGTQPENSNFNLNSEHFTVTFRTSPRDGYPGFQLSVTCFEPAHLDDGSDNSLHAVSQFVIAGPFTNDQVKPVTITLTPLEEEIMKNLTAEFFELLPSCVTNDVDATSRHINTSALQLSIAFENSSNPVIRTAVATTLSVAESQDSARVAEERIRIRDKCGRNNGGCAQTCIETDISVQCSCITGYALDTDERTCYEINECLVNNGGCEQICTNTPGSRQCSCRPGFVLAANDANCTVGLSVSITVDYAPPADFFPDDNEYRAGSGPVAVTCIATGPGTGAVSYQWSSTCGNCPFKTATSSLIRRATVNSGDNGTHTCMATKDGSTARASIDFLLLVLCPNPPLVQNGMRTFTGISVGDTATYTCNPDFVLSGNSTITCTQIDENSAAFPAAPECRKFLPYVQLDNTPGVTRNSLFGDDACSSAITIPVDFHFGEFVHTRAYVCTNGLISFGNPRTNFIPSLFTNTSTIQPVVAPFWADINVNTGGNIWYEIHTETTSAALLTQVNEFIQTRYQHASTGTWMLLAEWNNVPRFGSTSPLNTLQGLIITNGFQSYTVFTYQCGDINWGGGATIGFKGDANFFSNDPNSGNLAAFIDCRDSATGSSIVYDLSA